LALSAINIKSYTFEKGMDGAHFAEDGTIKATVVNSVRTAYNWIEVNVVTGINYYRIKIIIPMAASTNKWL